MKYLNLLSSNIKLLRLKNGLTQEEFAEKVGLTTNGVSNIERNRYQPTAETVDKICKAFNITPQELLITDSNSDSDVINNILTLLHQAKPKTLKKIYEIITILLK